MTPFSPSSIIHSYKTSVDETYYPGSLIELDPKPDDGAMGTGRKSVKASDVKASARSNLGTERTDASGDAAEPVAPPPPPPLPPLPRVMTFDELFFVAQVTVKHRS